MTLAIPVVFLATFLFFFFLAVVRHHRHGRWFRAEQCEINAAGKKERQGAELLLGWHVVLVWAVHLLLLLICGPGHQPILPFG